MPIMQTVIQGGGTTPTGTKNITANGIYDVTDFASADVQVPTTAPAHYIEKTVDANGKLLSSKNIINLNGVTDVSNGVLAYAYYNVSFPANTSIDLSNLTTISGISACQSMFSNCAGITSVNLSGLTTVSGGNACQSMFYFSKGITSADLSGLTTVSGGNACQNMFSSCMGLTSINISNLTTISGNSACQAMFQLCPMITSIDLSRLTTVSGGNACNSMFQNSTGITNVVLSSLITISGSNACVNMFSGCTGLTSAKLNALNSITTQVAPSYGAMFNGCTKLESVEFGGLTASTFASIKNQLQYLFSNTTGSQATNGCTVHFPSNFDPSDPNHTFDASTLTDYPTFGGSASYIHVAFDLPATES